MGYCTQCGTQIVEGTNFCVHCGKALPVDAASGHTATHALYPNQNQSAPQAQRRSKAPLLAGVVAAVLVASGVFFFMVNRAPDQGDPVAGAVATSPITQQPSEVATPATTPSAESTQTAAETSDPDLSYSEQSPLHQDSFEYHMCYGAERSVSEFSPEFDVKAVQWGLRSLGFTTVMNGETPLPVDGDYGSVTSAAVKRFHGKYYDPATADGIVDTDLWNKLQESLDEKGGICT